MIVERLFICHLHSASRQFFLRIGIVSLIVALQRILQLKQYRVYIGIQIDLTKEQLEKCRCTSEKLSQLEDELELLELESLRSEEDLEIFEEQLDSYES